MRASFHIAAAICALAVAVPTAKADVLLNTYPLSGGAIGLGWNLNYDQDVGVAFSTTVDVTLTSFVAAMGGTGTYRFGIQGVTSTPSGLTPSSSFIYSAMLLNPAFDASLSGLEWALPAGNYYFVIQAESFPSDGSWRYGTGGSMSWNGNNAGWNAPSTPATALLLNGTTAPIPEPTTVLTLAIGLVIVGAVRSAAPRLTPSRQSAA